MPHMESAICVMIVESTVDNLIVDTLICFDGLEMRLRRLTIDSWSVICDDCGYFDMLILLNGRR